MRQKDTKHSNHEMKLAKKRLGNMWRSFNTPQTTIYFLLILAFPPSTIQTNDHHHHGLPFQAKQGGPTPNHTKNKVGGECADPFIQLW